MAASTYGFIEQGRLYCYLRAHNPDLGRWSPGNLMMYSLICHEYGRFQNIDFMHGANEYATNPWANSATPEYTLKLYKSGLHRAIHNKLRS